MKAFLLQYGLQVYFVMALAKTYPKINRPGCGTAMSTTRIVHGTVATEGQFPWMVNLRIRFPNISGAAVCGASIITARHLLTAGHCTRRMNTDALTIYARYRTLFRFGGTVVRVAKYLRHPGFVGKFYFNDIAILYVERPIKFSFIVRPICIPSGPVDVMGKELEVAGWGYTTQNGSLSSVLQYTSLKVEPTARCEKRYKKMHYNKNTMLCAYAPMTDTCSGDSGGPMMFRNTSDARTIQVAIVSYGGECAKKDQPAVYTRLDTYVRWITTNFKRYELYKTIPPEKIGFISGTVKCNSR